MSKLKGFTLIEILIVLVIISIISGIFFLNANEIFVRLSSEAKLINLQENIYFLLSLARKESVDTQPIKIEYKNHKIRVFKDTNLDGIPDSSIITEIKVPDNIEIIFNGISVTEINDMYAIDGIFTKYIGNYKFDLSYQNCEFKVKDSRSQKIIKIINSLPVTE
ncbi:prepilin-type N-terminal cleavage/methylation domain-containing protein [Thermosipho ferrireducens]|uniref:Prepilin-type N-terminal cleavage/methylation domain-containing protein n=1 Tax=Thermosipho ferrireducens TaxID=2571116 RepID=A0ABX7S579_9BACT|nr:prepilin-type N-terminal cleavage/methylation domain-containing protein [Thermosipho ferrireducens]QTA37289.1 prepilin-type N-terminal cleavage/methylation domain-containing protein [Thermosipho ferrireducens]